VIASAVPAPIAREPLSMHADARVSRPTEADHAGNPADRSMLILQYGIALLAAAAAGVLALLR